MVLSVMDVIDGKMQILDTRTRSRNRTLFTKRQGCDDNILYIMGVWLTYTPRHYFSASPSPSTPPLSHISSVFLRLYPTVALYKPIPQPSISIASIPC